jgi:hypothetical protein
MSMHKGNHPIQPIETDAEGVMRFRSNRIVCDLLDQGPFDMNTIGRGKYSREDRVQFAQLIGYSLEGFGELSYVSDVDFEAAEAMSVEGLDERDAKIQYLEGLVANLRRSLAEPMARLFAKHPDDFTG